MSRNRILVLFLVAILLLGLTAAFAQSKPPVRIGYIATQTGRAAMTGEREIRGATLAEKQINAAGGVNSAPIQVVIYDSNSTTQGAVNAVNKAIDEKVTAILGPGRSTDIQAVSPIVKEAGIPALIPGTAVQLTEQGNPWLFRIRANDSVYGAVMGEFLVNDLKAKKIGILHDQDAFGTGGADMVTATLKKYNITPVRRERYSTGTKDYTAQLLNLKNAGAEAVVLYTTNAEDAAIIYRQIKELGITWKIVGCSAALSQVVVDLSGTASEGAYGVVDYVPDANAQTKTFTAAYMKEYNQEPDYASAYAYAQVMFLSYAMKKVGTNTDKGKIRQAILSTKGYKGVEGTYNFNANGDGCHEASLVQMKNKKLQYIKTIVVN